MWRLKPTMLFPHIPPKKQCDNDYIRCVTKRLSMATELEVIRYGTPLGFMLFGSIGHSLVLAEYITQEQAFTPLEQLATRGLSRVRGSVGDLNVSERLSDITEQAVTQLAGYISGERTEFQLACTLYGTELQRHVWDEIAKIPYGYSLTYGELAARIGRPSAVRAVANAVAANPIAVIVPCHRVLGAGGALTGYAGGLHAKRALLAIEASHSN